MPADSTLDSPEAPTRVRLRAVLAGLPVYKAGQRPVAREDLSVFSLASNENPYPPLPGVLAAIERAAQQAHRYPDPTSARLTAALAKRHDVPVSHLALGTGSVALCGQLVDATAGPGDEVLFAWRSFEAYPIWVQIAGATAVRVPLRPDERHDLAAMADAVTERTRLVFVCNPNNPTGTAVHRDELVAFLDRVPADVLVVIDEAYREFVRDSDVPDGIDVYRDRPNVVALRTFSKAYGLAALRVGFAVAHEPVAQALRQTATPFGVSGVAEEAALASLAAENELVERVAAIVAERERVRTVLLAQGWTVEPTQANFVWLRLGAATEQFAAACAEQGVTVRPFYGEGVRITVGEVEANDRVLRVAAEFRAS